MAVFCAQEGAVLPLALAVSFGASVSPSPTLGIPTSDKGLA